MSLKSALIQHLRGERYQGLWERLLRMAHVGMNHWGGSQLQQSGEVSALAHVIRNAEERSGKLIIDVGAHQGDYTAMALEIVPEDVHFVCFEPSGPTRRILEKKLAVPIAEGRVVVVGKGVGSEAGTMELHVPNDGDSVASLYAFDAHTRPWQAGSTEHVPIVTLDEHCRTHGIDRVLLLKIDVEGHELHVLRGAERMITEASIQFIQFEFGEAHIDARSFFLDHYRSLEKNYDLFRILPNGLRAIATYTADLEVFRTANYLAVRKAR